jgi:hypothetical protein
VRADRGAERPIARTAWATVSSVAGRAILVVGLVTVAGVSLAPPPAATLEQHQARI